MPEEILPNLFRIVVPLPNSPLKSVNSYIFKTPDRHLIVDTGMRRSACREAMEQGLAELDVDLSRSDFFITHLHSDHIGLVSDLASDDATVYFNAPEAEMMRAAEEGSGFAPRMMNFARIAGFSDPEVDDGLAKHPGLRYQAAEPIDFTIMGEGDPLEIGEYNFVCVHTPGHSPGHLCLYDAEKKLMLSGDHVLGNITPNISAWNEDENPLSEFMESLGKIHEYDVDLALPGHRDLIHDFRGRVEELREHHQERLDEVMSILDGKPMVGYDVASQMKWRLRSDTWEGAGIMQKWFATGEAIAHLRYLEGNGILRSEMRDGRLHFSRV